MGLIQKIKAEIESHLPLIDVDKTNIGLLSSDSPLARGTGEVMQMYRQMAVGFYPGSDNELMKRGLQIEQNQADRTREDKN